MDRRRPTYVVLCVALLAAAGGRCSAQAAQVTAARAEAASLFVRGLKDPDPNVRMTAFKALHQTMPGEAVPLLIPLLNDKNSDTVEKTISLLGRIRTREGITALIRLAEEKKGEIRLRIARMLAYEAEEARQEAMPFFKQLVREDDPKLRAIGLAGVANLVFPRMVVAGAGITPRVEPVIEE